MGGDGLVMARGTGSVSGVFAVVFPAAFAKKKDDNSVCSVLVHAIAAGGMVLFSHV
jgi:hypothetical protein